MAAMLGPSRNCIRCGNTFLVGRLGRKAVYCSRNCRQRHYEDRRALGLLAPLLQAARPDTSRTKNTAGDHETAPGPEAEG